MVTVAVLLLLMALTVLGLGGIVVSAIEGNIAANQYVAKQASFAAEAGADRAILWLQCYLSKRKTQLLKFDAMYPTLQSYGSQTFYDPDLDPQYPEKNGPLPAFRVYNHYGLSPTRTYNNQPVRFPDNVSASTPSTLTCGSELNELSPGALTKTFEDAVKDKVLDSAQGVGYTTTVELVSRDPLIWRVVSIGAKYIGGSPVTSQAVAYIVRKDSPKVNPPGALSVGGTLRIGGDAQISSDTDGKYGAIAERDIVIQGNNATITNEIDPNDAKLPNIGDGNLPRFWEIFFEDVYGKDQYKNLSDAEKDALALDRYRAMAKELATDVVPFDGTEDQATGQPTKGYKGLYFINMGNSDSARYQGGNALVSGDNGNDVAVLVIVNNGGMMCQRSGDYLANSNVLVNVNGANFKGFVYVVGEYDMQGNSTITGAVISTGNQTVDILGTGQGRSKIEYKQEVVNQLEDLSRYFKTKGSFADVGLLKQ